MANSVFVVTPPNGYTVFPGGMSQVPVYPNYQSQVQVIHGNPPVWPSVSQQPTERTLKEGKALGAIQILIGLINLGLGCIMGTVLLMGYTAVSFYGGFPFWGGIWAPGMAISGLLLIFCLLEVCVASASAHFGCQLTCYRTNNVGVVIPNVYVTNPVVNPEPENSPPNYSEVQGDK